MVTPCSTPIILSLNQDRILNNAIVLSDFNTTQTHNDLVLKQTLNHLAKTVQKCTKQSFVQDYSSKHKETCNFQQIYSHLLNL